MKKDKVRYILLKLISKNSETSEIKSKTEILKEDFPFSRDELITQLKFLEREGFISGLRYANNKIKITKWALVTLKGEEYIKDNSSWNKGYKIAKEARDWALFFKPSIDININK